MSWQWDSNLKLTPLERFEHVVWCGSARGLLEDTLPAQLAAKGIKAEDWSRFAKSCAAIMAKRWTVWSDIMAVLFLLPLPCLIGSERNLHKRLGQWLRAINEELLEPVGCYAKIQMVSETIQTGPNGQTYTEERAWLAVALTPEESEKLRGEVCIDLAGWWKNVF